MIVVVAPVGLITVKPVTEDCALHAGAATSQQLHCVELLALSARIDHPPEFSKNPETLDDDWLVIIDCPSNEVALSISLVGAAGGSNTDTKTTVAMTTKQAMADFKAAGELAKSFKSAGR
jgi:hypothetical protein